MKKILKFIVISILALLAKAVVRKYKPRVVMVTGSVGKTSTKDAVAIVLATRFLVRKSDKSFNSEFGVPFTILGVKNPWGNPLAWLSVLKSALALIILPNHYPNMLVLEVGSGKPGDLAQILKIVTPDAVVVTRLPDIPVHVEAYASPEAVREEEFLPAYALGASSPLIIPEDDANALDMAIGTPARVITYGLSDTSRVRITDAEFYEIDGQVAGMQANIISENESEKVIVKGSVGVTHILPIAAAVGVANAFDISLPEALKELEKYEPPPGRCRLHKGKNDSIIIDDSYNSSPVASEEALATLGAFPMSAGGRKRKIAVLGDMLELGRYSVIEHERIGTIACKSADIVVTVGIRARAFITSNCEVEVINFDNSKSAAKSLPELVQAGDVILVKGSQSIRTERIVKALLADPSDSVKLVRQEREWLRRQ